MRVGWDLDGVAWNFMGALRDKASQHLGYDISTMPLPALTWDHAIHHWGWSREEFHDVLRLLVSNYDFFSDARYFDPEFVDGLRAVAAAGHVNVIITARASFGALAPRQTLDAIAALGITDLLAYVAFTSNKQWHGCTFMIDDSPQHFWEIGADALVVRAQEYNVLERKGFRVVHSLTEYTDLVLEHHGHQ